MRSQRFSHWAAWSIFGLTLLAYTGIITTIINGCHHYLGLNDPAPAQAYGGLLSLLSEMAFPLLGMLILRYRPGNRIGWLVLLYGMFSTFGNYSLAYASCSNSGSVGLLGDTPVSWFYFLWSLMILVTLGLFFMTFPNGQFLTVRWQKFSVTMIALMSGYAFFIFLAGAVGSLPSLLQRLDIFVIPLFIFPLLGILSLFMRWRRAQGDERQQIKWVAFFLATVGTMFIAVEIVGTLFYPAIFDGWFYLFDVTVFILGFPTVFGLAIFKYRLYDIDIIIRRTLVYSLVTVALVLVYFGSVILLQRLLTAITGQESPLAIVVSTLLIAALFNPLRHRVQRVIDRRFYRRKYDAQQVLAQFAQTARDETKKDLLTAELTHVVRETMQPEQLNIWLKDHQ